jgi:hypothetical protein
MGVMPRAVDPASLAIGQATGHAGMSQLAKQLRGLEQQIPNYASYVTQIKAMKK